MKQKHLMIAFLAMLMCFASPAFAQVAKIGGTEYATLQAAMTEANKVAGDYTISLLKSSAEVFTFAQKNGVNITVDGDGNTFSGKITLNAGKGKLTFTDAKIAPANSQTIYLNASTAPNVTFDDCTLQGANKSGTIVYAYASATSNSISVKNCTADNLQYIVSNRQTGSNSVLVENVTATNMIYLVRTLKCPKVTIKNVTCEAVIGVEIKNDAKDGKLTLEDVNINTVTYNGSVYTPVSGSGAGESWTVELKGTNKFSSNGVAYEDNDWFSGNGGYVIKDLNVAKVGDKYYYDFATAFNAAQPGETIVLLADYTGDPVTLSEGVKLKDNGFKADKITVQVPNYVAMIGEEGYETLAAAFAAANVAGDNTITLLDDNAEVFEFAQNAGANIILDGYGKKFTGKITLNAGAGSLTIKNATLTPSNADAKTIVLNASTAPNVTIDECTLMNTGTKGAIVWGQASATSNKVVVKNSTASNLQYLVGTNQAGADDVIIENVKATNMAYLARPMKAAKVTVKNVEYSGLTFVQVKNSNAGTLAIEDVKVTTTQAGMPPITMLAPDNGKTVTYTITLKGENWANGAEMTPANEAEWFATASAGLDYVIKDLDAVVKIGEKTYKTFDEAYAAVKAGEEIELLETVVLEPANATTYNNVTVKANFGDVAFRIQGTNTVTFNNVKLTSNDYCFIVGEKDGENKPTLEIVNGEYKGSTTVISVTRGTASINGGTFEVEPYQGSYEYTLNCYDANYKNGDAKIKVNAGCKFKNFDPANNAAEGVGTNFIDGELATVKDENGYWNVVEATCKVGNKYYATLAEALAAVNNGGTLTLCKDVTTAEIIVVNAPLTIDGNGKTLTYTGSGASARAITVESAANGADLTLKNLTIDCTASYCQRGVNYNTTGALVLDGVTVKGANVTYALNLPGSSKNAKVTINKSSLTGNIALNVWGANAEINANDSHFTSVDNSTAENYSAIVFNNDGTTVAEGTVVNINGGSITALDQNGELSNAVRNATSTGVINVSEETVVTGNYSRPVAIVDYGTDQFYSCATLQAAIDKAIATNGSVKLIANVESSEIIVVNAPLTIDGNGKTLKSTAARAINVETEGKVEISNLTINAGERAINIINKPATVELTGVTATANNNAVMIATSAGAAKVTIDGCDFTGLAVVNVAGAKSVVAIKNSKITNVDANSDENYGAITVWSSAEEAVVNVENTEIVVADDSKKAYIFPANATVNGVDEVGRIIVTIGDAGYDTLAEAVEKANAGETIKFVVDATGAGVVINKNVTIDFNGKTYTVNEPVGSKGTETLGFQILKENNVTLKNGTLKSEGDKVKMLINNYANLTVDSMKLVDATDAIQYVLSNNSGEVVIKNASEITANGAIAFDACKYANYALPVVTVEEGVVVTGNVEVSATLNMNGTLNGEIVINGKEGVVNATKEYVVKTTVADSNVSRGENGYTVVDKNYVAQVGEAKYETLAEAIKAGNAVTLLADVNENVTLAKNITINGAGKNYTGVMTINNVAATIQNVNFVKGQVYKNKSTGNTANITIKDCTFDGQDMNAYAVNLGGTSSISIENVTAKNYSYGLLQVPSSCAALTIKNVEVSACNYGFKVDYANAVSMENVTIANDVKTGIYDSNYGDKTYTIKNSTLNAEVPVKIWERNQTKYTTFAFEGVNTLAALPTSQYAKVVAANAGNKYGTLAEIVADAENEATVTLLSNMTGAGAVINKNVTIDFNGKTYTVNEPVGSTGTKTLGLQILKENNVTLKNGTLKSADDKVKMLIQNYANLTVEDMNLVDATDAIQYVLSNNSGESQILGATNITTDAVAFDVFDYTKYYTAPKLTVETTGEIAGNIEVSETIKANLAIKNGTYTVDVKEWCAENYICKANADGTYGVIFDPTVNNVAKIGDNYYPTLRAAVEAAKDGDVVELFKNVTLAGGYADSTEGLRIEKAITLDGKGHTIDCGTFVKGIRIYGYDNLTDVKINNVTVVNNNVNGRCVDTRKGYLRLKFNNANLIATKGNSQPLTVGGAEKLHQIDLSGCTIDAGNSGYGIISFVATNQAIKIKNSEVSGYAGIYLKGDGTKVTITTNSNVIGKNVQSGATNGFGAVVIEGSNNTVNINATSPMLKAIAEGEATQAAVLVKSGANNTIDLETAKGAEVVTEGENAYWAMVSAKAENTTIIKDGVAQALQAECDGYQFLSLSEALRIAKNGSTVKLVNNIELDTKNLVADCDGYSSIINVEGKALTFDLNGKTMTVNAAAADLEAAKSGMLLAVFSTDEGGNLTLTDSSDEATGSVKVNANDAKVYSLVTNYTTGCKVTIEGGKYVADKVTDSLIYSDSNAENETEGITVNGGTFLLGNVGTAANGSPWIFNAWGRNERHINVNGGTFNADVNHQYWAFEVNVPAEKAVRANGNGTWSIVEAEACVNEKYNKTYNRTVGYATLAEAIAVENNVDNTVTLVKDVAIEDMITIANGKTLVLNLNGKTIAATDNTTKNYSVIDNRGNLTVTGEGKMTVTSTINSNWNRYSAVIANNPGGELTVEGGVVIEHLGGTDMAYGIDNLTNGKGTSAITTISNATVKSPYRAVRQFLNGVEAKNELYVNSGAKVEGANKSIFFHDPSAKANTGKLEVEKGAELNGDVYLFVTAGSEEWPVEVYVAKAALQGESTVIAANVPENAAQLVEYEEYWTVEQAHVAEMTIYDACDEFVNTFDKSVDRLTYVREFANAEWQTLYLPFAVKYADLKEEFDVAYIYNASYKNETATIDYVVIEDEEFELAANYPYLIKLKEGKEAGVKNIVVENATLKATKVNSIDCSSIFETFRFFGAYSANVECVDKNGYFERVDGEWSTMYKYTTDEVENTYFIDTKPFRFYLEIANRNGEAFNKVVKFQSRSVDANGNANVSGIENVDADNKAEYIFDLHGRRVAKPVVGVVYIVNGKKVIYTNK